MTVVLGRRALLASAAAVAAATGACARPDAFAGGAGAPVGGGMPSFAPLVRAVMPAVVNISVIERAGAAIGDIPPELRGTPMEKQWRDRLRRGSPPLRGQGSGFIIDPSGFVVTNNHVVRGARSIAVSLPDGTELPGRLVGADDLTDLALLRIEAPRALPAARWGDSRALAPGDWIIAAGNPFGLGGTVTAGIVSARGRDIGATPYDDFLQLDASINPGNSGGPVFNQVGEVVGVNTAIVSPTGGSVGIGFAVPSEIASGIIDELRRDGSIRRGWLGVSVRDLPDEGVAVEAVEPGSPAARAGVRSGDIVTAVNGDRMDSSRSLVRSIAAIRPGDTARLTLTRRGQAREISVQVGQRPPPAE